MSQASVSVAKRRFHVMYKVVAVGGKAVVSDKWRDHFGRAFSYRTACEEAERLQSQYNSEVKYAFKVLHEKLINRKENN